MTGVSADAIVLIAVLAVTALLGLTWRHRNGRMRAPRAVALAGPGSPAPVTPAGLASGQAPAGRLVTSQELRAPLGDRATLVQFSTAFCAPCRATRRTLAEVASMVEGVAHVEIDAESRLDLVRSYDIRRTPTVLVLGPDGRIAKRASGQPRKADVIAALGDVP